MSKIEEQRLEAAARAVAKAMGWAFDGESILTSRNPRSTQFVEIARAALDAAKAIRRARP